MYFVIIILIFNQKSDSAYPVFLYTSLRVDYCLRLSLGLDDKAFSSDLFISRYTHIVNVILCMSHSMYFHPQMF